MKEKLIKLSSSLESNFFYDYDMSKATWFKAGGKAKALIVVKNEKELEIIMQSINQFPYYILGSGSNLLVRDIGYDGIIIKLGKSFNKIEINEDKIFVGASNLDVNLSSFAKKNNIKGFEFFSGIPGTIGGAIKMNAGCFGSDTSSVLNKIHYLNEQGKKNIVSADKLNMKYRSSNILDSSIITKAEFNIEYGNSEEINKKIAFVKKQRIKNQPLKEKSSGSTFKNPPNYYAAKLIELSGCKGIENGDAIVSETHANFLINKGNASAKEIEDLGKKIIEKVYKKFNILLEWEIKIIGEKN